MKKNLISASLVILAREHNPTLLDRTFLREHEIVPKDWEVDEDNLIVSAPFSQVPFTNKFSIQIEARKLQISAPFQEGEPDTSTLASIASKYVQVLPHVKYTAIGHNISRFDETISPEDFIIRQFLTESLYAQSMRFTPSDARIRLTYDMDDISANVDISAGDVTHDADTKHGLLFHCNFHREAPIDLSGRSQHRRFIESAIKNSTKDFTKFTEFYNALISKEG